MALASSHNTKHLKQPQFRAQTAPPGAAPPKQSSNHLETAQFRTETAPSEAVPPKSEEDVKAKENHVAEPQFRAQTAPPGAAPPMLLRCIIISWCDERTDLFRTAAEREKWEAVTCNDLGQFMRNIFRFKYPLTIVDLPSVFSAEHNEVREATVRSRAVSDSLLVVSVLDSTEEVEIWARQLGAWTHLPGETNLSGLELIFREARLALAQQETKVLVEKVDVDSK